jgi:hypothetical protein
MLLGESVGRTKVPLCRRKLIDEIRHVGQNRGKPRRTGPWRLSRTRLGLLTRGLRATGHPGAASARAFDDRFTPRRRAGAIAEQGRSVPDAD